MRHVVVAGVTHRGVARERVAGGLDGRDDGAAAQDLRQLVGLDAKVEGLCACVCFLTGNGAVDEHNLWFVCLVVLGICGFGIGRH